MAKDKYIEYLKSYSATSGDINTISRDAIVIFEGEPLKIGEFLATIRKQHKKYLSGSTERGCATPLAKSRYGELDKLNITWEPRAVKQEKLKEEDPILDYITAYYDKNHTFNNMPAEVTINDETYNIRNFINHIRVNHRYYLEGEQHHGSLSPVFIKRYKALDDRGFEWEPQQEALNNDKVIQYLTEYYEKNKSLDNLPNEVTYKGEVLNITSFLAERRKIKHRIEKNPNYKLSELEAQRLRSLDKMNYDWDYAKRKQQELMQNDPYIRYLQEYYQKNHTINNISSRQEVIFEGKVLKIGSFLKDYRKKHYAFSIKGTTASTAISPLVQKRFADLENMDIDWRPSETMVSVSKHAKEHGIRPKTFKKYIKRFSGNIEKATKFCELARQHNSQVNQNKKAKTQTLSTIMDEFNVDIGTLHSVLSKRALKTTGHTATKNLKYDETTNLHKYCIDNGLNYIVIQRIINLKQKDLVNEDLQSLINRVITEYKKNGQHSTSTWVYSKYGNETLVRHLLLSMNLDTDAILKDMSKNCNSLEKAIENNCFARHSNSHEHYLKPLYHEFVDFYTKLNKSSQYTKETAPDVLVTFIKKAIDDYQLDSNEYNVIMKSLMHYVDAINTYQIYNVAFEKDPAKRVELILEYQLDDDEIEEAFYLPLKFDNRVLIGQQSELYNRRKTLKNLTQKWNNLSSEEKESAEKKYGLTAEEKYFIEKTRSEIDNTKEKVHIKRK